MNTRMNIMQLYKIFIGAVLLFKCRKSPVFIEKTGDRCIYVVFYRSRDDRKEVIFRKSAVDSESRKFQCGISRR